VGDRGGGGLSIASGGHLGGVEACAVQGGRRVYRACM